MECALIDSERESVTDAMRRDCGKSTEIDSLECGRGGTGVVGRSKRGRGRRECAGEREGYVKCLVRGRECGVRACAVEDRCWTAWSESVRERGGQERVVVECAGAAGDVRREGDRSRWARSGAGERRSEQAGIIAASEGEKYERRERTQVERGDRSAEKEVKSGACGWRADKGRRRADKGVTGELSEWPGAWGGRKDEVVAGDRNKGAVKTDARSGVCEWRRHGVRVLRAGERGEASNNRVLAKEKCSLQDSDVRGGSERVAGACSIVHIRSSGGVVEATVARRKGYSTTRPSVKGTSRERGGARRHDSARGASDRALGLSPKWISLSRLCSDTVWKSLTPSLILTPSFMVGDAVSSYCFDLMRDAIGMRVEWCVRCVHVELGGARVEHEICERRAATKERGAVGMCGVRLERCGVSKVLPVESGERAIRRVRTVRSCCRSSERTRIRRRNTERVVHPERSQQCSARRYVERSMRGEKAAGEVGAVGCDTERDGVEYERVRDEGSMLEGGCVSVRSCGRRRAMRLILWLDSGCGGNVGSQRKYFLTEPTVSPQHIDEFNLKDETSLSEFDGEEQNVLYFNDQFPFNVIYPDDLSDKDNDNDKIDIKQPSGDMFVIPIPNVINTDVGA
ncbi:hypothetical protein Tco_0580135 [Tanacetum coccineum]